MTLGDRFTELRGVGIKLIELLAVRLVVECCAAGGRSEVVCRDLTVFVVAGSLIVTWSRGLKCHNVIPVYLFMIYHIYRGRCTDSVAYYRKHHR